MIPCHFLIIKVLGPRQLTYIVMFMFRYSSHCFHHYSVKVYGRVLSETIEKLIISGSYRNGRKRNSLHSIKLCNDIFFCAIFCQRYDDIQTKHILGEFSLKKKTSCVSRFIWFYRFGNWRNFANLALADIS